MIILKLEVEEARANKMEVGSVIDVSGKTLLNGEDGCVRLTLTEKGWIQRGSGATSHLNFDYSIEEDLDGVMRWIEHDLHGVRQEKFPTKREEDSIERECA